MRSALTRVDRAVIACGLQERRSLRRIVPHTRLRVAVTFILMVAPQGWGRVARPGMTGLGPVCRALRFRHWGLGERDGLTMVRKRCSEELASSGGVLVRGNTGSDGAWYRLGLGRLSRDVAWVAAPVGQGRKTGLGGASAEERVVDHECFQCPA